MMKVQVMFNPQCAPSVMKTTTYTIRVCDLCVCGVCVCGDGCVCAGVDVKRA